MILIIIIRILQAKAYNNSNNWHTILIIIIPILEGKAEKAGSPTEALRLISQVNL